MSPKQYGEIKKEVTTMHYPYPDYFLRLEQRIRQLEEENQTLKEQVKQIKPIHIENINYKIQELNVKELKGTLNIGMTALTDPDEVKKWIREAEGEDIELNDLEQDQTRENKE
jgi:spore germination protein PC